MIGSIILSLVLFQPVAAMSDCSTVTIDNDASDWETIAPLLSDGQDVEGEMYYYNGEEWSTEASDEDLYSTDILSMQDLEVIKVCNSATQLQLYIDAYHPLLAYQDLSDESYYEFGDPRGPDGEMGLPANLDFWLVFKLQNEGSSEIYYYVIYLYAEEGWLGLEQGPRQTAVYKESDDIDFTEAAFNPNEDELLVEIDGEKSDEEDSKSETNEMDEGGKNIDASGGFESGPALMNADGEGLFNFSDIRYGDTLNIAVETYDGSLFDTSTKQALATSDAMNDGTDATTYEVQRMGVTGVAIPRTSKKNNRVTVKWDEITGASSYDVRILSKRGKVLMRQKTSDTAINVKKLQSKTRHAVQVRAKVGTLYTGWSTKLSFTTK